jgi:hypothetical protein
VAEGRMRGTALKQSEVIARYDDEAHAIIAIECAVLIAFIFTDPN